MDISGVDEDTIRADTVQDLVASLARAKAEAVATRRAGGDDVPADTVIVGCDSMLELDGLALGKPVDAADARHRWRFMRGRSGVLHTGHHLVRVPGGATRTATASTTVFFADLDDGEIEAYVATGEPLLVAGAFTIDGLGGPYVTRIEGDHHNVVGISLPLLRLLLADLGVSWTSLRIARLSQTGRSTIAEVAAVPVKPPRQPLPSKVIAPPPELPRAPIVKPSPGSVARRYPSTTCGLGRDSTRVTAFGWSTLVEMTASLGTENSSNGPFSKPSWRSVRPGSVGVSVAADGDVVDELGDGEPDVGLDALLGGELAGAAVGLGSLGVGSLGATLHPTRPRMAAAATATRDDRPPATMPANLAGTAARSPRSPPAVLQPTAGHPAPPGAAAGLPRRRIPSQTMSETLERPVSRLPAPLRGIRPRQWVKNVLVVTGPAGRRPAVRAGRAASGSRWPSSRSAWSARRSTWSTTSATSRRTGCTRGSGSGRSRPAS